MLSGYHKDTLFLSGAIYYVDILLENLLEITDRNLSHSIIGTGALGSTRHEHAMADRRAIAFTFFCGKKLQSVSADKI